MQLRQPCHHLWPCHFLGNLSSHPPDASLLWEQQETKHDINTKQRPIWTDSFYQRLMCHQCPQILTFRDFCFWLESVMHIVLLYCYFIVFSPRSFLCFVSRDGQRNSDGRATYIVNEESEHRWWETQTDQTVLGVRLLIQSLWICFFLCLCEEMVIVKHFTLLSENQGLYWLTQSSNICFYLFVLFVRYRPLPDCILKATLFLAH